MGWWRRVFGVFLALPLVAMEPCALANDEADFSSRPIRLIVPFEAGGGTDVNARIFAEHLARVVGQKVIVENRAGGAGAIAANFVAQSKPDGHTICWCTSGPITVLPLISKDLPYDPARDLRPVGLLYADDGSIAVRADLGVETLAQFVSLARAKPESVRFGSGGIGSIAHLAGERFALRAGIQLLHVPYKGEQYGVVDLIGGRIDMYPLSELQAAHLSAQGKVRVLAVRGPARSPLLPDVPTLAEAGYPDAEGSVLVGLFVPMATPDRVVRALYDATAHSLTPEVRERIRQAGGRVILQDAAEARDTLRLDSTRWEEVVKKVGLYAR